jgi:CheY-like chemotaxis protein
VKRVVIADDEPSLRLLVAATIETDDCEVLQAADGDEAWALVQQHHPDLVVLDVQMPGRTGLEVAQQIRDDPALAKTPIIMLSAKAQEADIAKGRAAGADLYILKPFRPDELLTAVEQALGAA